MTRLVSIQSECYECSGGHDFLMIPEGLDLEVEAKAWRKWYQEEYQFCAQLPRPEYILFVEWLKQRGATEAEVEIFRTP